MRPKPPETTVCAVETLKIASMLAAMTLGATAPLVISAALRPGTLESIRVAVPGSVTAPTAAPVGPTDSHAVVEPVRAPIENGGTQFSPVVQVGVAAAKGYE